jgi:hypothetical protein
LDGISGNIYVDWIAPLNNFVARTVLKNDKGDEITLKHALGQILINGELYWSGVDQRYIDVYKDFLARIDSGNSNVVIGLQDMQIIQAVRDWQKK